MYYIYAERERERAREIERDVCGVQQILATVRPVALHVVFVTHRLHWFAFVCFVCMAALVCIACDCCTEHMSLTGPRTLLRLISHHTAACV